MVSWLRRNLPGFERQVNRARNWDWLLGGWGTGTITGWLLAGLGALGGYVYAVAQRLLGAVVALVTAGTFAVLAFGLNQVAQLRSRYRTRSALQASPAKGKAGNAHPLRLEFGDGPGFDDIDPDARQAIRRVVSFALVNDGDGFLADCAVRFRGIIPPPSWVFAPGALLRDGIDLPPGQRRFVKLAYYDEKSPTGHVSQKIGLCTPPSNALGGGVGSLIINEEVRSHEIVLEASARGLPAVLERITLSVDDKGRLRLEKP